MSSPRRRRYLWANVRPKKVGITRQTSSGTYYLRSHERIRLSRIDCIPEELLFKILLHLPAHDIYDAARLVCRKWYHITRTHSFIHTHLQHSNYGLLCIDKCRNGILISVREGEIETYKFNFRVSIWTSCNGLVLDYERRKKSYVIANLLTGQAFSLPPYPRKICSPRFISIGYAAASMAYKVVTTQDVLSGKGCGILTLGVDKSWRFVSTGHLSTTAKNILSCQPLINEGFMHWHQILFNQVVTLNVETEIITETPSPIGRRPQFLFSTGRYLSLLISCGELVWEVWEMKPETREWRKLPGTLCLQGDKGRMEEFGLKKGDIIMPCGWVKYLEVLALKIVGDRNVSRFICFYNLCKREISSEKLAFAVSCFYSLPLHKNSLVSPL